ncbi:MAG TPA: GNAT family N-acetyltransferase [Candidatus Mediterraneibacter surreyensis]|nr:GNAT family N-acetyltransferase [Candidatus Mediterraneibacter surreyensis]
MIRRLQKPDIDTVSDIWLEANRDTHDFIPAEYWENEFLPVKEMLLQAEVYVYTDEYKNEIEGFVGLDQEYIAGIFVRKEARSKGIGKALLDFVKGKKQELTLNVYQKNERAVRFYERERFYIVESTMDESTGEKEYLMRWSCKVNI